MSISPISSTMRLREVNGAWWLATPGGELIVSLGLNQVEAPRLLAPACRRHTLKRYGDDFAGADGAWNPAGEGVRRWLACVRRDFRQWGFNAFGYHTVAPRSLLGGEFHYLCRIWPGPLGGAGPEPVYPDVFAPEFAAALEGRLAALCADLSRDAACLGYAFADQPPWQEPAPGPGLHPWVRQLAEAPEPSAGKRAWLGLLQANHGGAAAAAAAHGLGARVWEELAANRDWSRSPGDPAAAAADNQAMLGLVAARWYRLHARILRQTDPGRLILGDKLRWGSGGLPDYLLPILAEFTDLLCLECDGDIAGRIESLHRLHRRTGLPVLLVAAPGAAGDQRKLGQDYADNLRAAMTAGVVVGWHHSGYLDAAESARPGGGLFDLFGNPRAEALAWFGVANRHAEVWHARPAPQPPENSRR
ncbi:MAG: hypothetical protein RBU25_10280 [Lentisphaeria bacterium]|jgi:hypothetical protein|nr:hypothetical protein [Lentisphaeria bacterium]